MSIEPIIAIEESLDQLEHTHKCVTEYLCDGKECNCGLNKIREFLDKYRQKVWEEKREF